MRSLSYRFGALTIAMLSIGAASALAQQPPAAGSTDPRWAPWLGCWQLLDESVTDRSAALLAMIGLDAAERTKTGASALTCVTPTAGASGTTVTTLVNNQPVLTETIVADGSRRMLSEPDCHGWQRAEWSAIGPRLYSQAEIACADQPKRTVSGLALLAEGPAWIDVQMIETDGRRHLRVRRYARAANQAPAGTLPASLTRAAQAPLPSRLTLDDVKEANTKVAPEALQAAILELKSGFDLNGKRLVELSEVGVPASVIDLMVALTFPQKFVVERASGGGGGGGSWGASGFDDYWPWYADPYFYTSFYAPFGYRYWGRYDPYYFSGPGFVVINPGGGVPVEPGEIRPSGLGRVVDGRGYTRVTTRQPERASPATGDGNWGTSSNNGSSSNSSGGSSSGGVSSSGYSGGGGGGERTAVARPPGL